MVILHCAENLPSPRTITGCSLSAGDQRRTSVSLTKLRMLHCFVLRSRIFGTALDFCAFLTIPEEKSIMFFLVNFS